MEVKKLATVRLDDPFSIFGCTVFLTQATLLCRSTGLPGCCIQAVIAASELQQYTHSTHDD